MDITKLIDYIPAILILLSVVIITIIILVKYGDKVFDKEYKATNALLFVTAFLFITILIVHLFKEQPWTADTLKILIGVLVGAGSIKLNEKKEGIGSSVDISGESQIGGDVAGRDINKNIQNIERAISEIRDSVVHQNNQIAQFIGSNVEYDYIINTIYERGDKTEEAIVKVVQHWQNQGWLFKDFSSDYGGMDGIFLVFAKPKAGNKTKIHYFSGSNVSNHLIFY